MEEQMLSNLFGRRFTQMNTDYEQSREKRVARKSLYLLLATRYFKKSAIICDNLRPIVFMAVALLLCSAGLSSAANIKVVPSALQVNPGENFSIDIEVEDIPSEGLGAVQFRLNVDAPGSIVTAVSNTSQGMAGEISVATPLIIDSPTSSYSGIGGFFLNAIGPHGILVMDNETLQDGSALYTFGHTSGAAPPSGSGSVARFQFAVGEAVTSERIYITLTEVMLLNNGDIYPLESNVGATIELKCTTPNVLGLSFSEAKAALENADLVVGNIYEIDNHDGAYILDKVLEQSYVPGSFVPCKTPVDLAINSAPAEVNNLGAIDKTEDESGTVILSWTPSASSDTAGYRVYLVSGTDNLLKEITNSAATGVEISGLPNGQASQLKITAFDTFGNESAGVVISATPIDDVPPRITVEGVTDGAFYATDVLPVIDIQDVGPTTTTMTLNGISYDGTVISSEGRYVLNITVTDSAGNSTTKEISFVIDKTPPVITVTGIEKGRYYNTDVAPVITVTDDNLQEYTSLLNGEAYVSGTAISAEGIYELEITALDKAGNTSSDTYVFYIDKTKPVSTITVGEPQYEDNGSIFVTGVTTFILTGIDEGVVSSGIDRLEYRINNDSWTVYESLFTLSGLADGIVKIDYRALDRAGNIEDFHTLTVTVDNTSPVSTITVGTPKYQAGGNLYISGSTDISLSAADEGSGVKRIEYRIDNSTFTAYTGAMTLASYSDGTHTITYRSIDNLGAIEDAKEIVVVLDKTSPQTIISASDPLIDGITNTVSPKTIFTLSAADNLSGVREIQYKIDENEWQTYMADIITGFSLSGLSAGIHTISYRAIDNVENDETDKTLTVRLIVLEITKEVSLEPVALVGRQWLPNNNNDSSINNLSDILSSSGITYYIPESEDDFKASLRSGRFNTYILIDFKEEIIGDELREAVNYGDGVVFIKTQPYNDPSLDEVFGVKFTGKTTGKDLPVNLLESPISDEATIQCSGKNVVATIISETAESFGYVVDKNSVTYPSIVSNQYGRGRSILFSFDLLNCEDQGKVADLLLNSIYYVTPPEHYIRPLDSVPINIKTDNSTEPVDLKVTETIPYNTTADTIIPQAAQTEDTIIWEKSLDANEKATFGYYLNLPDMEGDYIINTEVRYSNNQDYRLYGSYNLTFNIPHSSDVLLQTIITELGDITTSNEEDAGKIEAAIAHLNNVNTNASDEKEAERNIRSIIRAIDTIRKLSFDVPEMRLKLDELMKIWQVKWYLLSSSE